MPGANLAKKYQMEEQRSEDFGELPKDKAKIIPNNVVIKGGYFLKARCIENSVIANASPCTREIWDLLLRTANYRDNKTYGVTINRGSLFTTYDEIREALHWMVGYRKEMYSKHAIEASMKLLTKEGMIAKSKTTRGVLITICKYDYYQNPKNYEDRTEDLTKTTGRPQRPATIPKERKEFNKKENTDIVIVNPFSESFKNTWEKWKLYRAEIKKPLKQISEQSAINKLFEISNGSETSAFEIIENSISNSWVGLFPLRNTEAIGSVRTMNTDKNLVSSASGLRRSAREQADWEMAKRIDEEWEITKAKMKLAQAL